MKRIQIRKEAVFILLQYDSLEKKNLINVVAWLEDFNGQSTLLGYLKLHKVNVLIK